MNKESFAATYETLLGANGLAAYLDKKEQMFYIADRLVETNAHMNLTAITDEVGVVLKHIADSLTVARYIPEGATLLDVGCGAGFPSLPLAAARPDVRVTAIDSTEKKVRYVAEVAEGLGLADFRAVSMRAEEGGHDPAWRESFDVCTARAVASLPLLAELCLPFLRPGGRMLAMKSRGAEEELAAARAGIEKLCGSSPDTTIEQIPLTLTGGGETLERVLIVIQKGGRTPKNFPRNYSQMKKKPL